MNPQARLDLIASETADTDATYDLAVQNPQQWVEMLCCQLRRVHEIAAGQPFYDYSTQGWVDLDDLGYRDQIGEERQ